MSKINRCKNCLDFKPFKWTDKEGFCNYGFKRNKAIVRADLEACKHFDDGSSIPTN